MIWLAAIFREECTGSFHVLVHNLDAYSTNSVRQQLVNLDEVFVLYIRWDATCLQSHSK